MTEQQKLQVASHARGCKLTHSRKQAAKFWQSGSLFWLHAVDLKHSCRITQCQKC